MRILLRTSLLLTAVAPITAQSWTEHLSGETYRTADTTLGEGPLTTIHGSLDSGEAADIYVVRIDDPATFRCTSVGGASFDTQLWLFDLDGNGISFRDDDGGSEPRSTLTGQFVPQAGTYLIAISESDNDALDQSGDALWNDAPSTIEREPDGPGAAEPFAQWSGVSGAGAGAYTLQLAGAAFAWIDEPVEAELAWAWIGPDNADGTSDLPPVQYQYTPTGERITCVRHGVGRYELRLPNYLGNDGVVTLSAYGAGRTPVIRYWDYESPWYLSVHVAVYDAAGAASDGRFTFNYRRGGLADERAAYAWADEPALAGPYVADTGWSWNGNRADPTVERINVGNYRVTFPGLKSNGPEYGNVQITPYVGNNFPTLRHAQIANWSHSTGNDVTVNVRMRDGAGALVDSQFTISYHEQAAPVPAHRGSGAHLYASQPSNASPYLASDAYSGNNSPNGGDATITRTSVGAYRVHLPGLASNSTANVIVTPYGASAGRVYVSNWTSGAGGVNVNVRTTDLAGSAADRQFTLSYVTDDPAGTAARNDVIGSGCADLTLTPNARPVLGETWKMSLTTVPAGSLVGVVALGFDNPALALDFAGAPGCFAYQDLSVLVTVPLPAASPSYQLPIPVAANLIGGVLYAQGAVILPGLNALGVATSNGIAGVMGDV